MNGSNHRMSAASMNLDIVVDDDEAHIAELNELPEKKWFAKLAHYLAIDCEAPPHVVMPILHRFYGLDVHGVVHACQFGVPWGTLLLAEFVDKYWDSHEEMTKPPLTSLVSALRTAHPGANASFMLLALSRTSASLEEAILALRWGGQFHPDDIRKALQLIPDEKLWGFFPPNKDWMRSAKKFERLLESEDLTYSAATGSREDIDSEEVHNQLKSAAKLHEIVIGKWRELTSHMTEGREIPSDRMADALQTAFDAATRLATAMKLVQDSKTWLAPLQTSNQLGSFGQKATWAIPSDASLPRPPFSADSVSITWDESFWYRKSADAFSYLATFLLENDEIDRAIKCSKDGLAMARRSGDHDAVAKARNNLAHVLIVRANNGDLDEAETLLDQAAVRYSDARNAQKLGKVQANMKRLQIRRRGGADTFERMGSKTIDVPEFTLGIIEID